MVFKHDAYCTFCIYDTKMFRVICAFSITISGIFFLSVLLDFYLDNPYFVTVTLDRNFGLGR